MIGNKLKLPVMLSGSFFLFCLFLLTCLQAFGQQQQLTVRVEVEEPAGTPVPFSYVVNRNSGIGEVTDFDGRCTVQAQLKDSLIVSHVGYKLQKVAIASWKDSIKGNTLRIRVVMFEQVYELKPVVVRSFEFTPNEKEYYKRIAYAPEPTLNSPVTYIFDQFSREGKTRRKMKEIYDGILLEEMIVSKVNDDKVRRITGDSKMTLDSIRKMCFIPDHYILSASEYDLYKRINDCYVNNIKNRKRRR